MPFQAAGNRFHGADAWAAAERLPGKNCSVFKLAAFVSPYGLLRGERRKIHPAARNGSGGISCVCDGPFLM